LIIRYGGLQNASSLRKPFQHWSNPYARSKNLILAAEIEMGSSKMPGEKKYSIIEDNESDEKKPHPT
jgi:hypothetical protein